MTAPILACTALVAGLVAGAGRVASAPPGPPGTTLITASRGGVVDLGDGSRMVVPPNGFAYDAYVRLTEHPNSRISYRNPLFAALPGVLNFTIRSARATRPSASNAIPQVASEANRVVLTFHVPPATFTKLTRSSLPFVEFQTTRGVFPLASSLDLSHGGGTVTIRFPRTFRADQSFIAGGDFGIIDGAPSRTR